MINNRREFLAVGAAALTLPAMAGTAFATLPGSGAANERNLPFRVLFDRRFPGSRSFAQEAERLGAVPAAIDGDVSQLWYEELRPRFKKGPAVIVGMTDTATLFCIEQLASDHWMKVRFRADHHDLGHGLIEHRLSGQNHIIQRADALSKAGSGWSAELAKLVTHYPTTDNARTANAVIVTHAPSSPFDTSHLVTWIIAANS